jgi:hypothetical protein
MRPHAVRVAPERFRRRSSMISASVSAASRPACPAPALGRWMGTNQWTSGCPGFSTRFRGRTSRRAPAGPRRAAPDPEGQALLPDSIGTCQKRSEADSPPRSPGRGVNGSPHAQPGGAKAWREPTSGGRSAEGYFRVTPLSTITWHAFYGDFLRQNGTLCEPHHVASAHSQTA